MDRAKNYIAWFYILALFFVIPVYNAGSFMGITQRKVEAFFFIAAITVIAYGITTIFYDLMGKKDDKKTETKMKNTGLLAQWSDFLALDGAMLLFLVTAVISTIFSDYRKESIYGVTGFGTGLVAIFVYVASYFLISRYLKPKMELFYLIVLSSVIPVVIAIINRLGADPLGFYLEGENISTHQFVSTIGNYGWFSAFLVLIITVEIYLVVTEEKRILRIALAVYLVVCLIAIVLAGNSLGKGLTVLAFALVALIKKVKVKAEIKKSLIRLSPVLIICLCIAYGAFIIVMGNGNMDSFGNGRGYIWRLSLELYKGLPVGNKITGVGPNCFMYAWNDHMAMHPSLIAEFTEHFEDLALTSAHSEYFDYLINTGILGFLSYVAVIIMLVRTFLEKGTRSGAKEISMLCCVIYLCYMLLNFSIVCATPYFFIFMGIVAAKKHP
jgi:O-antigen ligase